MTKIGRDEFAQAVGRPIDIRTEQLLAQAHLDYRVVADQQGMLDEIQRIIDQGFDKPNWSAAWEQTLKRFIGSGYDLDALNPLFVGSSTVHRWQGQYIEGIDHFERRFNIVFRDWVFRTFLSDVANLYEFGSGSGINVAAYSKLFADTPIIALDFAPASVQIALLLREKCGMKINSRTFDFLAPDHRLEINPSGGVLTWCALEQIGKQHDAFIDFLVARKPKRVVHIEPIAEDYLPSDPFDQVALEYHEQRGYLKWLLTSLQQREMHGTMKIIYHKRTGFGSRFHEGYSVVVWEPRQ